MNYHGKNEPEEEPEKTSPAPDLGAEFKKKDCLRPYLHHNDQEVTCKKKEKGTILRDNARY